MVFVHSLGFKNSSAWNAYCRGQRKDLPPKPADVREEDIELKSEIVAFFDQHDRKRARPRAMPIDLESRLCAARYDAAHGLHGDIENDFAEYEVRSGPPRLRKAFVLIVKGQ